MAAKRRTTAKRKPRAASTRAANKRGGKKTMRPGARGRRAT